MNDTEIIRKAVETIQRLGSSAQDCKSCARLTLCNAYQDGDSFQGCDYKWIHADDAYGLPFNQWISVKDRLPEDDGKYMVWYKGELDICEFAAESQTFGYTCDDYDEMYSHLVYWDDGMDKDITHWLPLPEPPKDGDTK